MFVSQRSKFKALADYKTMLSLFDFIYLLRNSYANSIDFYKKLKLLFLRIIYSCAIRLGENMCTTQ